ncbi:hypothetical protein [Desertivibrio insolitus]|uniref:hypothetical protein n=1 Tax=Herbiconiux sp. SYSU D00978 TaxID=2812562 RepID=UPI001A95C7BE|nr:hypothetical protein [Herbiconiux sp. SYSU D00978]
MDREYEPVADDEREVPLIEDDADDLPRPTVDWNEEIEETEADPEPIGLDEERDV